MKITADRVRISDSGDGVIPFDSILEVAQKIESMAKDLATRCKRVEFNKGEKLAEEIVQKAYQLAFQATLPRK